MSLLLVSHNGCLNNNKLHEIHPQLGLWPGSLGIIRCEKSDVARMQIGHSYLTHSFLLKDEAETRSWF